MNLVDELLALAAALDAAAVDYCVCGGVAVAIHGHPRFTKDIDVLVLPSDLESVRTAVRACGFSLEGGRLVFGAGTSREREVHRVAKAEGADVLTLELLIVGPSTLDAWNSRQRFAWLDRSLWVVSREGLMSMKRLAGRPQDLADIDHLSRPVEGGADG